MRASRDVSPGMSTSAGFEQTFRRATGWEPYDYQRELGARDKPPSVIEVPTGSGKTMAALIPWLCDVGAPRRLVYALPMRTLVEQTARLADKALRRLGDDIPVHVLMGGVEPADWRLDVDRRAVIVGTVDMLLSRALNRGYAESRFAWPVAFGLLNNDCRWVFDEIQLMGPARTTSAQLHGLRERLGAAGRCETVWMSATVDHEALRTFDHPHDDDDVVRLSGADRAGPLRRRLVADKRVERLDLSAVPAARAAADIAEAVHGRHRAGTRSIVVVNRVELAQQIYYAFARRLKRAADPPALALLHSRFRPPDRADRMSEALAEPSGAGTIVVATQVIEAGVDLSSALLATETAPFSSIVQRLGRCNRAGEHERALALWLDRGDLDERSAAPYHPDDIAAARVALRNLEGRSASPSELEAIAPSIAERREASTVLRRRDLVDLFDTAPDLSGTDVDIAPYIRQDDDRSVSVFFRALGQLTREQVERQPAPGRDELVAVPIAAARDLPAWRFDIVDACWRRPGRGERVHPGATLMLDAGGGCYSATVGWTGRAADAVQPLPAPDVEAEAIGSDHGSRARQAVTLEDHLAQTATAAQELAAAVGLDMSLAAAVVRAAALHDAGKAHPAFQEMLRSAAPPQDRGALAETVWAKSAYPGGRHVRPHFRHELASALALGNGGGAGDQAEDDLVRYLVAAHHGRVRLSIRPAPEEQAPADAPAGRRFALGVVEGDVLPAVRTPVGTVPQCVLPLVEMELGAAASGRAAERFGRFRGSALHRDARHGLAWPDFAEPYLTGAAGHYLT